MIKEGKQQTVHCPTLPFTSLLFITDRIVAAGGFDNNLHILAKKSDVWQRQRMNMIVGSMWELQTLPLLLPPLLFRLPFKREFEYS